MVYGLLFCLTSMLMYCIVHAGWSFLEIHYKPWVQKCESVEILYW